MDIHKGSKIGDKVVGEGHPVFITFEAGPTHSGLKSAKELVSFAAQSGADAIKFQIFDPDRLVADRSIMFEYEVLVDRETGKREKVSEPLFDLLERRSLSESEWREIKAHSDSLDLAFFATIGYEEDIALLEDIGCHSIKIASGDVNHLPFIRKAARTGMCLQLDTGNSTIGEIESAIDVILAEGNESIVIHHCPSGYPARLEGINLRIIPTLAQMFGLPVAFSDHSPGWHMDIAAVALGVHLVEKTITADRTTRSIEHIMSIEPDEMAEFVTVIRDLEIALGNRRRLMSDEEKQKRRSIRRSAHARMGLPGGHVLQESDIEFRRPERGVTPDRLADLIGARLNAAKPKGEPIDYSDLSK